MHHMDCQQDKRKTKTVYIRLLFSERQQDAVGSLNQNHVTAADFIYAWHERETCEEAKTVLNRISYLAMLASRILIRRQKVTLSPQTFTFSGCQVRN